MPPPALLDVAPAFFWPSSKLLMMFLLMARVV